jgi:hypothetical protein
MQSASPPKRRLALVPVALLASGALVLTACGGDDEPASATGDRPASTAPADGMDTDGNAVPTSDTKAAALRASLTALLQEHVYLAGIATGTALSGDALEAPAAALDENSQALADAIGSVYGDEAGEAFLGLWRSHIDMFVDYTTGVATGDEARKQGAIDDLTRYAGDFAAFLADANPNVDPDTVVGELTHHVGTLTAAIDAQGAGDPARFTLLREAAGHMDTTAAYLAEAIVAQHPDAFTG